MLRYSLKVEKDLTVFSLTFLVQDRSNNGVGNDRFEYWNTKFSSQDTYWFRSMFSRNRFQSIFISQITTKFLTATIQIILP
jgi:hypothetical protein